jgi:AraC-like DNA-binding protein
MLLFAMLIILARAATGRNAETGPLLAYSCLAGWFSASIDECFGMPDQLVAAVLRYINRQGGESPYTTAIDGVMILRSDRPKPPSHAMSRPAICIVVQGEKWATIGVRRYVYRAGQALVVGIETPSLGRVVQASPDKPCLVLAIALDLAVIRSVAEGLDDLQRVSGDPRRGVVVTDFQGPLSDCARRLIRLLDAPKAIPTVYPLIMREMCYWLLSGRHGAEIARMALRSAADQRVMRAITHLRERFAETVRVEELAGIAHLSPSAFHRQFKALTSVTPLQYQKRLRLLEARRLMISSAANAESAAFSVGYQSPSQFSREYTRMFGAPPKRHATPTPRLLVAS